jgi:hypothetical protein
VVGHFVDLVAKHTKLKMHFWSWVHMLPLARK